METINYKAPFYKPGLTFDHPRISKNYIQELVIEFDPIMAYDDGTYMLYTETDFLLFETDYESQFEEFNINFNGISWSEVCRAIISIENKDLLNHLKFDSEGGGFYAFADSKKKQLEIAKLLSINFNDRIKLKTILENIETNEWGEVKESR